MDSVGKPVMLNLKGTITTGDGTVISWNKNNVIRNNFSISDKCVKGSTFSLGAINSASLNATMYLPNVSAYSLVGQTIQAFYGVEEEYIILGTFEITKATSKENDCISIVGATQLNRLNYNDDKQNLPATWLGNNEPFYILQELCNHANVTFSNTLEEIQAMPNGTLQIGLGEDCTISSTSELISYIATILGGFVTADRYTGGVKIKQFQNAPCYTVPLRTVYRGTLNVAGFSVNVINILANFYENGAWSSYAAAGRTRESMNDVVVDFTDNPFLDTVYRQNDKNLSYIIAREIEVGDVITAIPYNPFSLCLAGLPALELGDCVSIELRNGSYLTSVISSYTFSFRGQHKIQCVGEDGRTVGGVGITDTLRLEEHINQRINSVSRTKLMKKSEYEALGDSYKKNVLYCLCNDDETE